MGKLKNEWWNRQILPLVMHNCCLNIIIIESLYLNDIADVTFVCINISLA